MACYLLASLSPLPILGLTGCALCGFSVGIMWPGTISLSSQKCPQGGTAMFAFLALAGDFGGTVSPVSYTHLKGCTPKDGIRKQNGRKVPVGIPQVFRPGGVCPAVLFTGRSEGIPGKGFHRSASFHRRAVSGKDAQSFRRCV